MTHRTKLSGPAVEFYYFIIFIFLFSYYFLIFISYSERGGGVRTVRPSGVGPALLLI